MYTHYDILGVNQNCTEDEIKKAFIELSKKYHPDKAREDTHHDTYLRIMEAYKILGKRKSRIDYDLTLPENNPYGNVRRVNVYPGTNPYYNETAFRDPYSDPSFYKNRDKSQFNYKGPYYGIKGINRVSNAKFALVLCALGLFLGTIKTIAMFSTVSHQQSKEHKKTTEIATAYNEIRSNAVLLSNNEQVNNFENAFNKTQK